MTARTENTEAIEQLFGRLQREFGNLAPLIIKVMVDSIGGLRITFPDLQDLYRQERNRLIRNEFTGFNHEELAIKYRLKARQVRRIIQKGDDSPAIERD
ncbi:MAG: Mor transcription activator family protein [Geobacter sp.]